MCDNCDNLNYLQPEQLNDDTTTYTDGLVFKVEDALTVNVWLAGEDAEDEPQLVLTFARPYFADQDGSYYCLIGFANMSDGVEASDMQTVLDYANKHVKKLNAFHDLAQ